MVEKSIESHLRYNCSISYWELQDLWRGMLSTWSMLPHKASVRRTQQCEVLNALPTLFHSFSIQSLQLILEHYQRSILIAVPRTEPRLTSIPNRENTFHECLETES